MATDSRGRKIGDRERLEERVYRGAATNLRRDEIDAALELFRALRTGGDTRVIMRSDAIRSLERKLLTGLDGIRRRTGSA